ncbi:MAG: hypothetical protein IH872_03260 [Chloroflexi bacterium]|nr:hypothetical protein [Chloroflexota bacterium]
MNQTDRQWVVRAQEEISSINGSILTISGAVLGFSIALLSGNDLESSGFLKTAWIALGISIGINSWMMLHKAVDTMMQSEPSQNVNNWKYIYLLVSVLAFLTGLGCLIFFGYQNV